ncbi:hypothetical protein F5B20DRAFT_393892 [Whalleya microplaca]|nr:hypothetical protein F5B20DRAFT_393892 [Whalleya microplaca]
MYLGSHWMSIPRRRLGIWQCTCIPRYQSGPTGHNIAISCHFNSSRGAIDGQAPEMDWLASLRTVGLFLYSALILILKLCYILAIPLYYPIYYCLSCLAFLLSPFLYMFNVLSTVPYAVVSLVVRLKYLYIYLACAAIIGICAGCMLYGTSSSIFVLLGVDASQQRGLQRRKDRTLPLKVEGHESDELDSGAGSGDSSSRLSLPSITSQRAKSRKEMSNMDANEQFEKQWKLLRSSEKPRRRRKGLLSQTIHEESSESDFS